MKSEEPPQGTVAAQATAGTLLRQARQAAGLSVTALADAMKLPEARLQALEDDNHAFFPDHVLMRALAQSLCRTLRADPAPVLALLPRPPQKNLLARGPDAVRTPFRQTAFQDGAAGLRLWHWLGAAALLLGAAALIYFFPAPAADTQPRPVAAPDAGSPNMVQLPVQPLADAPPPTATIAPAAALPSAVPAAPEAGAISSAAVQEEEAAATHPAAGQAAAPAPEDSTAPALLHIHASAPSWVQVKTATGRTLQQKTLAAGQALHIDSAESSALPLAVVIGNAAAVQVQVRGQAMPLAASTREGVARFALQ